MKKVSANHEVFTKSGINWAKVGVTGEVEIHLGINSSFDRQLIGDGNVPCWCVGRNDNDAIPSMPSSPGFVIKLDFDGLVACGFTPDEIFIDALHCNEGTWLDTDHDNDPVCGECLAAIGEYDLAEGNFEPGENEDGRQEVKYPENQVPRQVCWSCREAA